MVLGQERGASWKEGGVAVGFWHEAATWIYGIHDSLPDWAREYGRYLPSGQEKRLGTD